MTRIPTARGPARAGRGARLAKLAEALFIETLRRYMADLPQRRTGWLAAARDAAVGRALGAIHRQPARAWTVASLAQQAGVSRSVFAERFTRLLGEGPLAYVSRCRLQLGVRLLETTDDASTRALPELATLCNVRSPPIAGQSRLNRARARVMCARFRCALDWTVATDVERDVALRT